MIQELLGGAGFNNIGGERKFSITETILQGIPSPSLQSSSSSSSSLSSPSTTTAAAAANNSNNNNSSSNSDNNLQNLRCPRCDSSNTKFCYYNNYNLTQPRHFCKTCRRYWTKGGALRNVPIGGGCRKNKSSSSSLVSNSVGKSSTTTTANKMKTVVGYEIAGRSGLGNGFDYHHHLHHQLPTSPVMWASPQNSQLLAILRATQQSNHVKEEGGLGLINGTPLMATDQPSSRTMVLDPLINNNNHVPSTLGLCSSLWKNNHHHQAQQYQQQQNGILVGHEVQNSGFQELYQRLKSSTTTTNNYYSDHQHHHPASTIVHGNATCSASSSTSTILESAPVAGGDHQLGYWNPALSWSDLQTTTNGAYP
ncbi:hypothetical protein Ddye_010429 [Dipteronia dyeriana]|uniref:Dof zinc finger protein n=1 Tax=Dipteronia dyeriana TaxID=168575 RepID=A0AAD9XDR4_9ROSI|nr:hypothetical protein Ddye_010429 [Dipteronia dyeriana]